MLIPLLLALNPQAQKFESCLVFCLIHNLFLVSRLSKIFVLTKFLLHCTNNCDKSVKIM